MSIYLDYNASAPLHPKAQEAMIEVFQKFGNPSSVHKKGKEAKTLLNKTREILADVTHTSPQHIYFTSGGTEANAIALLGTDVNEIITSSIEHDSVYKVAYNKRCPVTEVAVLTSGCVDLFSLEKILREKKEKSFLVSLQYANNETGVVQPIKEILKLTHFYGGVLHVDAVQALGKLPVSLKELPVDLMSFSAHKIGGPKGVGALYVKEGAPIHSLYNGGGQERSIRSGTENSIGIAGFGAALKEIRLPAKNLQTYLESSLGGIRDITIHGKNTERLFNTTNFSYPHGLSSDLQVMRLDLEDIYVSAGSACSSGKVKQSRVLRSMGIEESLLDTAIRVSTGPGTTQEDIDYFLSAWMNIQNIPNFIQERDRIYA